MQGSTPLIRHWLLLKMLSSHRRGLSWARLAAEFQVSVKTIRRDLEVLRSVGFPLAEHTEAFGRTAWRIEGKWHAPDALTFDEAPALYLGRQSVAPLAGTLVWEAAERAFAKIRATLGESALKYLNKIGDSFHQTTVGVGEYAPIGDPRRTHDRHRRSPGNPPDVPDTAIHRARHLRHPSLRHRQSSWFLVPRGACRPTWAGQLRHWKVSRIGGAELTDGVFHRPEDFDLHEHFSRSGGIFHSQINVRGVIWFSRHVAR